MPSPAPDAASVELTSVVTVIHNSGEVLGEMLRAIPADMEVVVVDNASTDGGAQTARQARPDATVVTEPNRGFGAGCNAGAAVARGDVVIFLNPDCRPRPGALQTLAGAVREDRRSIFGPALLDAGGRPRHNLRRRSVPRHEILEVLPASVRWTPAGWRRDLPETDSRYALGGDVDYLQGACLAIDRARFAEIGGFDEDFFLYSEEETLCEAVVAAGGRCRYLPTAQVGHIGETSTAQVSRFALRQAFRSRAIFYRKRYGEPLGLLSCAAIAASTLISWLLYPLAVVARRHATSVARPHGGILRGLLDGVRQPIGRPATPELADILGDSWYARELGLTPVRTLARGRLGRRAMSVGVLRGGLLWWAGRRRCMVVTPLAGRATQTLFVLERLFGRRGRYLVLLEFIPVVEATSAAGWRARVRAALSRLYWRHVVTPVLRRCVLTCQSLTRWEIERNATVFGLPRDRFCFTPFMFSDGRSQGSEAALRSGVLASGRAACDWETVFAAAEGQSWALTVVCSATDLPRVTALNADGRATVLSEISYERHEQLMASTAVYLLALREAQVSSGHVRLIDAVAGGAAVVAGAVHGLEDYLEPEENALTFPPGDPVAARVAVNRLLEDGALRSELVEAAERRAERWTLSHYLEAVRGMVVAARRIADPSAAASREHPAPAEIS